MKLDIKALLILAVIIGAAALFWLVPGKGLQAAPNAEITTIDGNKIATEQLKGKPYSAVFWATSCSGCVKEIPQLVELQQEFGKDGFKVLAIAMEYDELPLIKTMREQKGMNYDITWDQGGVLAKAFGGVRVTPTNFLVSGDGKIVMQQLGDFKVDDMRERIKTLL